MIVRNASDFDYAYVCRHMRAKSWREATAMRGEISPERLAREYNELADVAYFRVACCANQAPIALFSAYRTGADFAAVHFVATTAWPSIGAAAYRFLRGVVFPQMFPQHGIARAQTDVLAEDAGDRAWLHRLGFVDDGPPTQLGKQGEMFQRVTWRAVDAAAAGLASAGLQQGHASHV